MTFKKLLASAGAAALLASGAHAATATGAATTCYADTQDFTTSLEGDYTVTIAAVAGELTAGPLYKLDVTVSGATFGTAGLAVGDITETFTTGDLTGVNVTGGADGDATASVNFSMSANNTAGNLVIELPLEVAAAGDVSVSVTLTNLDANFEVTPATSVTAASAVSGVTAAFGVTGITLDSIDPAAPETFDGADDDQTDIGSLVLTLPTYDATCAADAAGSVADVLTGGAGVDFGGTALAATQFGGTAAVTSGSTQTATLTAGFTGETATALGADFTDANFAGATTVIELNTAEDADLAASQFAASGTVTHASLTDLAVASTDIGLLQFAGTSADIGGDMRWFALGSTTANSVIRCTASAGFSAGVTASVTVDNVSTGTDGSYTLASSPAEDSTEFVIAAADIATAASASGRADITDITFVAESNAVECDRLLVNTTTGTVTPFGNGGK